MNTLKNIKTNKDKELKNSKVSTEIADNSGEINAKLESEHIQEVIKEDIDTHFKTLLVGFAQKLSSKSKGLIGYELALNTDDKHRYLRLTSNDSGGLFSKEWVKLDDLYAILEPMDCNTSFKSSVFKTIIKGGSANNVSFLSAVLRCEEIALIQKSEKSQFQHVINPLLVNQQDRLAKLKPMRTASKT